MKKWIISSVLTFGALAVNAQSMSNPNIEKSLAPREQLTLTQEWDKVFI